MSGLNCQILNTSKYAYVTETHSTMRLFVCGVLFLATSSLPAQSYRVVINTGCGWPVSGREVAYAEGLTAKSTPVSLGAGL